MVITVIPNKQLLPKSILTLLLLPILAGCVSNQHRNDNLISENTANSFFTEFEKAQQQLSSEKDNLKNEEIIFSTKQQPENKLESCTLQLHLKNYASDFIEPKISSVKSYWDGECKNGHAHGLGREFWVINNNRTLEIISEYLDGHTPPKIYAFTSENEHELTSMVGTSLENSREITTYNKDGDYFQKNLMFDQGKVLTYITILYYSKSPNSVIRVKLTGDRALTYESSTNNFLGSVTTTTMSRGYATDFTNFQVKGKYPHSSIIEKKSDRRMTSNMMPYSYFRNLDQFNKDISEKMDLVTNSVDLAKLKKLEYRNMYCDKPQKQPFFNEKKENLICLENEQFEPFIDRIKESARKVHEQEKQVLTAYVKQQEKKEAEFQRQYQLEQARIKQLKTQQERLAEIELQKQKATSTGTSWKALNHLNSSLNQYNQAMNTLILGNQQMLSKQRQQFNTPNVNPIQLPDTPINRFYNPNKIGFTPYGYKSKNGMIYNY